MARIVIGQRTTSPSSPMGCWVAAPGGNAETGAGRMVLDSQRDHLKLWATGAITSVGQPDEFQEWSWIHSTYPGNSLTVGFPALPYVPIVFASLLDAAGSLTTYPFGIDVVPYDVTTNSITFAPGGFFRSFGQVVRIGYHVFANRRDQIGNGPLTNAERVLIEANPTPRFRVSRPGYSVHSTDESHFLIREDREGYRPSFVGSRSFGGTGTSTVGLSGFSAPPFVVLKSSDLTVPARENYFARVNPGLNTMTIHNRRNARTISYAVYATTI